LEPPAEASCPGGTTEDEVLPGARFVTAAGLSIDNAAIEITLHGKSGCSAATWFAIHWRS